MKKTAIVLLVTVALLFVLRQFVVVPYSVPYEGMEPTLGEGERVRITGSSALMESRTISRLSLDTVVNARLKELFAIIRERLEDQDLVHRLHAGAVLTGGGAGMKDIQRLAEQELGMSVRIGRPIHMDGLDGEKAPWAFAAISGALMYAHANYEDRSILDDIFGRFFK